MNANAAALGLTTSTDNGGAALTHAGAVHAMAHAGERGAALAALSLQLVGHRGSKFVRAAAPRAQTARRKAAKAASGDTKIRAPTGTEGVQDPVLVELIEAVMRESADLGDDAARDNAVDLLTLAFDIGDVREGKGERNLFCRVMMVLAARWPRTVVASLALVPEFACWRTLSMLAEEAAAIETDDFSFKATLAAVQDEVARLFADQLSKDAAALEGGETAITLAGKWAPSETSRFQRGACKLSKRVRLLLFPLNIPGHVVVAAGEGHPDSIARLQRASNFSKMQYRRLIAKLRRHLGVVETYMCANKWDEIVPTAVPSIANKHYAKAFLNVPLRAKLGVVVRSEDPRRVACATAFKGAIADMLAGKTGKKLKGALNHPHELVKSITRASSAEEESMIEALWAALVSSLRDKGTLKPSLAIVDVSGSMEGLPMEVAIALGLILAELSPDPWHGRMITFSQKPQWFTVPNSTVLLRPRVTAVRGMPWGTSTDFAAALELVLSTAIDNRLPQDQMPAVMFVLTDMHFDAAASAGDRDPHASALIQRRFAERGYTAPHIVFWNLRASGRPIFQAETDRPGVSFMSGFSAQVLTDFMDTGVLQSGPEVSPWDALSARLARPRLDAVRALCATIQEGPMAGYAMTEPLPA